MSVPECNLHLSGLTEFLEDHGKQMPLELSAGTEGRRLRPGSVVRVAFELSKTPAGTCL